MAGCTSCAHDTPTGGGDTPFRRILWIALAINAAMFVAEVVASFLSDSVSLQAGALDFFGDASSYAITLFVLGMGVVARTRAALLKAATMGAFGLWVIGMAVYHAITGIVPEPIVMGPVAVLAFAANASVAILLFRHRAGDSNRRSVWLCSRNDAIGNVTVFAAALGVWGSGTGWPDYAVAAVIASLNLSAAIQVLPHVKRERQPRSVHAAESREPRVSGINA